jgi:hypothetical protein
MPPDEFDGGEQNPVRRYALEIIARTEEELTDVEVLAGDASEEFWYTDLCLEKLRRLPSEIDPLLLCRTYTNLQAYHVVKRAMDELQRRRMTKGGH